MRTTIRVLKWAALGLGGLALLALLWVLGASQYQLGRHFEARPERLAAPTPALLADAPRQARIMGCLGCHGEGLGGRTLDDIPHVARIHAPNLPAFAARVSDQQLARAIRQGIAPDGRALWVMPSPMYANLGDAELAALIAWIRTLPRRPGEEEGVKVRVLGRLGIALGQYHSSPQIAERFRTEAPIDLGPAFAAGRRITLTACTHCHGPSLSGQTDAEGPQGPDLRIAAAYTLDQFRTLIRTGRSASGRDLDMMDDIARGDLSHLTDAEIAALHAYLTARAQRLN
jgi:cytochrome c553